jgi:hypothetical protein
MGIAWLYFTLLLLISVRGYVHPSATVRLEVLRQMTNPMVSSGAEPATFDF